MHDAILKMIMLAYGANLERDVCVTFSNVSGRRVDAFTATAACVALAEVACVHPRLRVGHATTVMLEKWNVRGTPLLSPTAQFSFGR